MSKKVINVTGETCPVPLVETRKAVMNSEKGDIISIKGDHPASKKEIPMAMKSMNIEIKSINEKNNIWEITLKI